MAVIVSYGNSSFDLPLFSHFWPARKDRMSRPSSQKLIFLVLGVFAIAFIFQFTQRPQPFELMAPQMGSLGMMREERAMMGGSVAGKPTMDMMQSDVMMEPGVRSVPPMPPIDGGSVDVDASNRKQIVSGDLSLQVSDVKQTVQTVEQKTAELGGFVVSSSLNNPGEASSGYMSVRVPSAQSQAFLDFARGQAVKVVSENFYGQDVTDQYTDLEAQRALLTETKTRFEGIYRGASTTEDILEVQRQILDIQRQLDAITGQLKYLENVTDSTLISLHLSTDDLSLPYAPDDEWRPAVVFKTAVRSLVRSMRGFADTLIWVAVYAPVLLVVGGVIWIGYRVMKRKK